MNMRSNILFFFLLLFGHSLATAQPFFKSYVSKTMGLDVIQTPDGGYVMAGVIFADTVTYQRSAFIARTDADGDLIWVDSLGNASANAVCLTTNNTLVWVSETYQSGGNTFSKAVGLQADGTVLWETEFAMQITNQDHQFTDIAATSDGGVLLFGSGTPTGSDLQFRLVKLNTAGDVVWETYLGDPGNNERSRDIVVLPSGDLMLSGDNVAVSSPIGDLTLIKTDASGGALWQQWYDKADWLICVGIAVGDAGQVGMLTTFADNVTQPGYQLLTVDADGDETGFVDLTPNVPGIAYYSLEGICYQNDGTYTITGAMHNHPYLFLHNINAQGETQFLKIYDIGVSPRHIVPTSDGGYAVTGWKFDETAQVTRACLLKMGGNGELYTNTLQGNVFLDDNNNCLQDPAEQPLGDFIVRLTSNTGQTYFTTTLADGSWTINVDTGAFSLVVFPRYGVADLWLACDPAPVVVSGSNQTVDVPGIGVRSLADCPYLDVDLGNSLFRPCLDVDFTLTCFNNGNQVAEEAYLELTVDPLFVYVSSELPATPVNDSTYRFDLGDLAPGAYQNFKATFNLSCDAQLGQTLCAEAHIYPDTFCAPPDPLWDGSHLEVQGICNGSEVEFIVRNNGTGNMTQLTDFVIIEDQIIYMQGKVQLDAGKDSVFTIPNTGGNTYYMSVEQTPLHPGNSHPAAGVDYCDGPANPPGLLLQLAQNEGDFFIATLCDVVRTAYDPNDKQGFPLGWQNANYIERGQELDYMIRFQNTGNDTAFLVVLRDTIDQTTLDITSIRPGASSHPYTWELTGNGVLKFTFENILLPDSNTNLTASQGYVQFRIRQQPNLAAGTQILNSAGIYFDFNAPVITNTSLHTIADDLVSVSTNESRAEGVDLRVFPNPFVDQAQFVLEGLEGSVQPRISVFNTAGQLVRQEQHNQSTFTFRRSGLETGLYFYRIDDQFGKVLAGGRIVVGGN
ncbi:MAG: T9SS type A sorting domain-containing protein [Saprospiraceae bacterium]|nr:T9SS type A sorting domain-containing protein [Saprospiraceae bacterium]